MKNGRMFQGLVAIKKEYERSREKFQPFHSPHEGLSILREEYKELEEEVFKNHDIRVKERMYTEAKHVAAMALSFMVDCCGEVEDV